MRTELPMKTFCKLLHERDKALYYKWAYRGVLTAAEKDVIWCVGQQARRITNCKEQ